MKKGGGKGKGSAFERKVCVLLSLWVTNGKKKDAFWRSSMSGGRATIHVKRGDKNRQAGDITAVAPEGHQFTDVFFAECKHVRNLDIASFFTKGIGRLAKFWAQAKKQAAQHDRRPMLIAKQNNQPVLVVTEGDTIAGQGGWACHRRHVRVCTLDAMLRGSHAKFRARNAPETGSTSRRK
jgi:hypothetical protein